MGMLPIYIGVEGEENQGLCTGSENYWCVNSKASEEDIRATLDFLNWVITSDEGRTSLSQEMGFVTPFKTFDKNFESENPLVVDANKYIADGKTSVAWNFTTMPSEEWKNQVGSAMLEYAQGTGEWDAVRKTTRRRMGNRICGCTCRINSRLKEWGGRKLAPFIFYGNREKKYEQ